MCGLEKSYEDFKMSGQSQTNANSDGGEIPSPKVGTIPKGLNYLVFLARLWLAQSV